MREREIIATYFAPLSSGEPGSFSLVDDAAILTAPTNKQLVITTDSVIEAVHVLPDATPEQYAMKLMRRNLSDLAAMGATPWRYLLNVRVPRGTERDWFVRFTQALAREQERFGLVLVGGDTTIGGDAIHLTLTALGLVESAPLTRSGAKAGDTLYVSGTIGDAALGLAMLQADHTAKGPWIERYHTPQPRLALGNALRGIATAALDCSDGLLKDTASLCEASNVGVELAMVSIPVSQQTRQLLDAAPGLEARSAIWQTLLTGGDDYELIFTAPASAATGLQEMARFLNLPLTAIGTITTEKNVHYRDESGALITFGRDAGFEY